MIEINRSDSYLTYLKTDEIEQTFVGIGKNHVEISRYKKHSLSNDYSVPIFLQVFTELSILIHAKKEFIERDVITPEEMKLLEEKMSTYSKKIRRLLKSIE